jgi:hypothetical protein
MTVDYVELSQKSIFRHCEYLFRTETEKVATLVEECSDEAVKQV